jgi:signal transduction histidine kinase
MLYLLVLAPIIGLRRTFRQYYEQGVLPKRSARQDEIGKLQNTFVDMVDVLEGKSQSERRLIASVSHDIKTPLTSVMGYSERLLSSKSVTPEKQKTYLRNIYDKAISIKDIVDEFDDYLEAGLHDTSPMYLMTTNDFCRTVCNEYQDELSDAGVQFIVECHCPGEQFRCNYGHMRRFLGNLIGNSIQHAKAEPLKLRLLCTRENDQIVLSFSDNGQGVPPEILDQIFEPFFTTDRGRKVSGLGLAICENIIRTHGGTISAQNLPKGGLQIQARLPCASN